MGRASRRAQERADRRQKRQQAAPARPPASTPAVTEGSGARGSLLRPRWLLDIISELRKVTWPTRQETAHLTLVVIIVSILFGIVLGSADLGFSWLIENTILR
ncbi:MAG TPA: preprotein translocase subunit SecE [Dehalococcoidia bacterium]|nr:preprotein translocase subunit SecE [Dehalococcoidia bacterium]